MNKQPLVDRYAAFVIPCLLILVAWGNAVALLVFAVVGLAVGVLLFRKSMVRGGALVAAVGLAVALVIAPVLVLL